MPDKRSTPELERILADLRQRIEQLEAGLLSSEVTDQAGRADTLAGERLQADLIENLTEAMEVSSSQAGAIWAGGYSDPDGGPIRASRFAGSLPDTPPYEHERFFAGLASAPRVGMVKAMLERGPLTVGELVEVIGAQTTGQVYHHLRALAAAGIAGPRGDNRYGLHGWAAPRVAVALSLVDGGKAGA